MPLTPSNPVIQTNETVELTTTIANAIWLIASGTGSLSAGSTGLKRIFTPSGAGVSVVRASSPIWSSVDPSCTQQSNGDLLLNANSGNYPYNTAAGTLVNIGDSVTIVWTAGAGKTWYIGYQDIYLDDTHAGWNQKNPSDTYNRNWVAGDVLKFERISNGAGGQTYKLILNGTLVHTYTTTSTDNGVSSFANPNCPVGTIFKAPQFSNAVFEEATVTVTAPASPTITSPATLPTASLNIAYSHQLAANGGTGAKSWSIISQGTLPIGAMNSSGLISIQNPAGSQYTFTARVTDANGQFDDQAFTIPVSNLQIFDFCLSYPIDWEYSKPGVKVAKPILGARQTRGGGNPKKRKLDIKSDYYLPGERTEIIQFWDEHHPDKDFLFHDKITDEYILMWISSTLKAPQTGYNSGDFAFTIEEV